MLTLREAADYCGLTSKRFQSECPVAPLRLAEGVTSYDMRDLDGWLDGIKGSQVSQSDNAIIARLG
jgi:hypothetical protein